MAKNTLMRVVGITYSDGRMSKSADRCVESMKANGFNQVFNANNHMIAQDRRFCADNPVIYQKRGAGYWLWKPYVVQMAMHECEDGDTLVYADAGVEFVAHTCHIIDVMDEDIFLFTNGFRHVEWCKGNVLNGILHWQLDLKNYVNHNYDRYLEYKQVQASVIFFRVNQKTRDFVKEWLLYCQMPGFIDDSPSNHSNYPTFAEHRHDQAILTCLQIKYGYKLHWWPTQYSEHIRVPGDNYPVIFNHHRKRNPGHGDGKDPEW